MTTDLAINLQTGDLVWSQNRDLSFAQGENVTQQRVHTRLLIPQGSFIYDITGSLGSLLQTLLNEGVISGAPSIEMMIRDALEPMTDINIVAIQVNTFNDGSGLVQDPRQIKVQLTYTLNLAEVSFSIPNPPTTATFILPTAA